MVRLWKWSLLDLITYNLNGSTIERFTLAWLGSTTARHGNWHGGANRLVARPSIPEELRPRTLAKLHRCVRSSRYHLSSCLLVDYCPICRCSTSKSPPRCSLWPVIFHTMSSSSTHYSVYQRAMA